MVVDIRFGNFEFLNEKLTRAEIDIGLRMLAGQTRKEIAADRGVSHRTVDGQIERIMRRFRVGAGPHLLAYLFVYLMHHGIIDTVPAEVLFPMKSGKA